MSSQPPAGGRQPSVHYPAPNDHDQGNPPPSRNSTRSSTRGSGREGSIRAGSAPVPAVQTTVTRLLVATKHLLESLTQWSKGELSENGVSDVYVRMGNDFNSAVAAFQACGIDMSDLLDVPEQLRRVLETALAEDATPENLDLYQPEVRAIIKNLLQGLRVKQHDYKISGSRRSDTPGSSHERSNSVAQSERSDRTSVVSRSATQPSRPSSFRPDPSIPMPTPPNSGGEHWVGGFATPQGPSPQPQLQPQPTGEYQQPGPAQPPSRTTSRASTTSTQPQPYGRSPQNFIYQPVHEETDDDTSRKAVLRKPSGHGRSLSKASASSGGGQAEAPLPRITSMAPQLPPLSADIKRYSLSDNPIVSFPTSAPLNATDHTPQPQQPGRSPGGSSSSPLPPPPPPNLAVETPTPVPPSEPAPPPTQPTIGRPMSPSPPPETPTSDGGQTELNDKALSALKSREVLTRRASKRFSTYTYNKMTSTPSAPATAASSNQGKNRRSMVAGNLLSAGDLNTLSEVEDMPSPKAQRSRTLDPGRWSGAGETVPPVPPLPATSSRFLPSTTEETAEEVEGNDSVAESTPEVMATPKAHPQRPSRPPSPPSNRPFTVFLQLESQVRKAEFEPGMTLAALRILFVEKFAYNPGLDNFPDIYIRDPTSQVMYELEDINEVREKSLLSLNIEPLGQIKQHIDSQMSSLSQDIRELKSSVSNMKRLSVQPVAAPTTNGVAHEATRPTERAFQTLARRLSKIRTDVGPPDAAQAQSLQPPSSTSMLQPQPTGTSMVSQSTGTSNFTMMSDAASVRIVSDLKTQFDEIVLLRRDLGVMRQMYVDFVNQTKSSISNMRTQAQAVRQMAGTKVSGDRAYVVAGREKLDSRTTTLLTKLEELQDSVENLRHDVVKRHVTPRPAAMKLLKETINSTAAELQSIQEYISTVQPMWKQTWAKELASIVEEQEFLRHISEFVEDLAADHAEAAKIFDDINGVVSMRPTAPTARTIGRTFRPPPLVEEGQGLTSVFSQIQSATVDPEQRMRAIEASQRQRKLDLAGRSDAFTQELSGYVQGKRLKMTGGAEEAERVRQKRNDVTLKAMFGVNGSGTGGGGASVGSQPSPSRSTGSGSSPAAQSGQLPGAAE